ncbi:MAG: hypothetical protein ACXAC7_13045 [Candidatus Hodarchaeales archaeon]|jgi:tRNA acetyltransferase TAN1
MILDPYSEEKIFQFYLISSSRHEEKNALSEAVWLLHDLYQINNLKVKNIAIPGLGLLESAKKHKVTKLDPNKISKLVDPIKYCFKIIPLENYMKYSEESLVKWVNETKVRIQPDNSWRITLNKRQTQIKSQSLISEIARHISVGKVDLKKPDKIWQIEILGGEIAVGLITSHQILRFNKFMTK